MEQQACQEPGLLNHMCRPLTALTASLLQLVVCLTVSQRLVEGPLVCWLENCLHSIPDTTTTVQGALHEASLEPCAGVYR